MKILVVEDDHKIAGSIKKGFTQEGFVVDLAYDGEEGFDLAMDGGYDIIILDLMLPKKDGICVSKDLRAGNVHTPILMLTARGTIENKLEGFKAGTDDYMVKPFSFEELLARVRSLSRRPKETKSDLLKVGDLALNTNTFDVRHKGKSVELSRKEYSLLEFLMKSAGRVVSKNEIISRVWDYESDILPNTVEVFVRYLRNKLGKNTIKTIRGFGYKIG